MANVTGAQIIAKAKTFLGKNGTQFWKDYGCPSGWAWCVIFVWDIFRLCGASNLFYGGGKVAGCGYEKAWLDKNCTKVSLANAKEGDIVMFSWRAGEISHTGFAIKPLSSTVLQTIEGNTSGGIVAIRQRAAANILGIYRPKYYVAPATKPKAPTSNVVSINKTYRVLGKNGSNIRRGASTSYGIIGGIGYNKTFNATKQCGNWVYSPNLKGWICIKSGSTNYCAEVAKTPTYKQNFKVVTRVGVNIRKGPGTSYAKISAIPVNTTFTATKKSGNWVYSEKYKGWICISGSNGTYLKAI